MPSTYTSPYGNTPQGQALASGMPSGFNSQAPSTQSLQQDLAAYPSDQALNAQYGAANANLVNLGTANARQEYITNSNLPAMQTNYEDLAKKLFEYDTGVLNPKFQGQNPGLPSDAASFGRVEASPLALTMQAAGLPASQGLSTATQNPKYAYASQVQQAGALNDLMSSLNTGINTTLGARIGTYRSDRQAAQDALDSIFKIMGLKQSTASKLAELIDAQAEREARKKEKESDPKEVKAEARLLDEAKRGVTYKDLLARYYAELPASRIRELYNQVNYYKSPAKESAEEEARIIQGVKKPAPETTNFEKYSSQKAELAIQNIDNLMKKTDWGTTGPIGKMLEGIPGTAALEFKAQLQTLKSNIATHELQAMRDASKTGGALGQVSNRELNLLESALGSLDTAQSPAEFKRQLQQIKDSIKNFNTEANKGGGGTARKEIVSKLKSAGYNDDDIHKYLRQKGIDK